MHLSNSKEIIKNWENDYEKYVTEIVEQNIPCYILFRLDDILASKEYAWLLISWVPEESSIRHKMVYASTKATLKSEFGSAKIKEEFHATTNDELSLKGYYKHKSNVNAPAPLTMREEELNNMRKTEINTDFGTDSRQQTLTGLACKLQNDAIDALHNMLKGHHNYLQFEIDLKQEEIKLDRATTIDIKKLPSQIPNDHARYHLYLFKHTHEGDYMESYIFIYSMPGYTCNVKERMMYSSCKGPFVDSIQSLGLEITKKVKNFYKIKFLYTD